MSSFRESSFIVAFGRTGREEPQIDKPLPNRTHLRLAERTSAGLELYVKAKVTELQGLLPLMQQSLMEAIELRSQKKAKGMFFWVRVISKMLMEKGSELEVERAIDDLPGGLDEAYRRIIKRIQCFLSSHLLERAFRILYWVCVARRPLTLAEIADGVTIGPDQMILDKKT